jgi:excisionase family DNA binding protein
MSDVDRAGRFSRLDEPLLTPREAAALLSVPVSWIYAAARERRLPCVRLGRHIRFARAQLEQFVLDQAR